MTDAQRVELGYPVDPIADEAMAVVFAGVERALAGMGDMPPVWRDLALLGVAPGRQGNGLGSALLGRVLSDAAAAGEVVGLVTTRPVNLPFYARAGLTLVWEGTTEDGTVPFWSFRSPVPENDVFPERGQDRA